MKRKNIKNANRIRKTLQNYAGEAHDLEANLKDALTDMRHLCDKKGLDFHALLDSSYQHYLAETQP